MAQNQQNYQTLHNVSKQAALLGSIEELLHWDQETHMPAKGAAARAEQLALMAKLAHEKRTSSALREQIDQLIDLETGKIRATDLSTAQQAALREWRRDYLHATKLPPHFVEEFATHTSQTVEAWRKAREASNFAALAPHLQHTIDLCRQRAEYLGYEEDPYDALLDEYEPGMKTSEISTLFTQLRDQISSLRKDLLTLSKPKDDFLYAHYPEEAQMEFGHTLLEAVGYSDQTGRVDLSTHPFCLSLHPTDSRLTTRVDENDPMQNFLATLHEGGHHLYEISLPAEQYGSPLGQAASMAVHESQSRWWETLIGLSLPFWEYYYPQLQQAFPTPLQDISLDTFYRALHVISSTPIRIHSDEISYPLHIILRFELETALISGNLAVKDLPEAWNAKMRELLDISPQNDAEGCLQDIHWASSLLGYFPTYTLGNIYATQLFATFATDYPDWAEQVAQGEFAFIRQWLKKKVHQHGRALIPRDLIETASGKPLTTKPYLDHLNEKYHSLLATT